QAAAAAAIEVFFGCAIGHGAGFEAGALVGDTKPESVRAGFAFDQHFFRLVALVAMANGIGHRFFESHLHAKVVAAARIPAEALEFSKNLIEVRVMRTAATGQLLLRGPMPA